MLIVGALCFSPASETLFDGSSFVDGNRVIPTVASTNHLEISNELWEKVFNDILIPDWSAAGYGYLSNRDDQMKAIYEITNLSSQLLSYYSSH